MRLAGEHLSRNFLGGLCEQAGKLFPQRLLLAAGIYFRLLVRILQNGLRIGLGFGGTLGAQFFGKLARVIQFGFGADGALPAAA